MLFYGETESSTGVHICRLNTFLLTPSTSLSMSCISPGNDPCDRRTTLSPGVAPCCKRISNPPAALT